jgi:hypothetical protein
VGLIFVVMVLKSSKSQNALACVLVIKREWGMAQIGAPLLWINDGVLKLRRCPTPTNTTCCKGNLTQHLCALYLNGQMNQFKNILLLVTHIYSPILLNIDIYSIIFQWLLGRLRHGILPVNTKKIEQVISNQRVGLDQFIKTLNQKEKRGYTLSDELGLI